MIRVAPVFWSIAALDAVALIVMLVAVMRGQEGHGDGGHEMALFFFVIVPGVVLLLAVLLFTFWEARLARAVALLVVAAPALFWVWEQIDDVRIDRSIADRHTGAGYFRGESLRAAGVAVIDRDVATLQRIGPTIDPNAVGESGMTLLALAVDRNISGVPQASDAAEVPVVRTLLALGARPDAGLPLAVKRPDATLLRMLLDAGGNANLRTAEGHALVFEWYAVMKPEALRLLAAHGLDVNSREGDEPMAVLFTIYQRWDLVDALVDLGTDIDRPRPDGRNVRAELAAQMADAQQAKKAIPGDLRRLAQRLGLPVPETALQ